MRTVAGADQPEPLLFRQDRYPFPYLPPTMKAPLLRSGTITMQCARSSRSCGIPLSGAAITSEKTDAAAPSRLAGSVSIASSVVVKAKPATIANLIFLPLPPHVLVTAISLRHGEFHLWRIETAPCRQRVLRGNFGQIGRTRARVE